ncbi:hypothetical protein [Roseovarius sp. E0-M6]|uniref:hypothetical protein n=1 Tax=Roseovarius sp. E0-M6 TaxID=3127118 RepID=UPI00300FB773
MKGFHMVAGKGTEKAAQGRYEFRVWLRDWPKAASALQRFWPLVGAERRSDIYLLNARSPYRLVKLRAGDRLESKRRGHELGPLQYWVSNSYPIFPLARPELHLLAQELGVARLPFDAGLSPAHLVARLGASTPEIMPEPVYKSRLLFRKGSSRVELSRVAAGGQNRVTLALEDPDPKSALQALDTLRIGHLRNRSYGEVLCRRVLPRAEANAN